ncbi:MAG: type IV pilin protein [Thermodesulfobacteriota bacterium]
MNITGRHDERGFTLIELIVVIVILGILSAVVIPVYQDMRKEAASGVAQGLLGSARGAATINFSRNLVAAGTTSPITADLAGATALAALIQSDYTPTVGAATIQYTIGTYPVTLTITAAEDTTAPGVAPATITLTGP